MRKASRARLTDATRRASRLQRDHKEPRVFGVGDAIGEERDVVRVCPHERGDLLLVRELAVVFEDAPLMRAPKREDGQRERAMKRSAKSHVYPGCWLAVTHRPHDTRSEEAKQALRALASETTGTRVA